MYLLSAFFEVVSVDSGEIKKQTCEQTGLTLECNYIPQEIPQGITVVHIVDWFENSNSDGLPSKRICNGRTFQSNTWENVTILEINDILTDESIFASIQLQSECFSALKELKELHLHLDNFDLNENAFVGLEKLQILDFRRCSRLDMTQLNKALKGPEKVPNLSEISLSHAGYISNYLQLDEAFVDALSDKPVKKIEASDTQITTVSITEILENMKHLEKFNVSNTKIGYAHIEGLEHQNFQRLKTIDLEMYENSMEFIHPSLLAIVPNLQSLDLSDNFINAMAVENFTLFETLLKPLKQLKTVYLSNDGLRRLPSTFFEGNMHLEVIDLSSNWLKHVTFNLGTLKHLRELNLCNNNIVRLGQDSLNNLNNLLNFVNGTQEIEITLLFNPISCAECGDRNSIDWILGAIKSNLTNTDLQCQQENGTKEEINKATLEKLQTLCRRKVHIKVSAITVGIVLLVIISLSVIIYKRRKIMKHRKNKAEVLSRLRDGENAYEFVAFLGYSSDDENFVNTYVINQMNETLQQIIGINRNLICTGDKYFRPGRMVHDEIATCLERSCVMVVLISDLYCSSVYCRSEFDQAHIYGKPIVLMVRGHVDEDMMSPAMKQLYRKNARVLWSEENGEYVLKTTWENVCSSILDLIK
ncbi:toll-like receptor Tollo [Mercenaria mercenaria]|uniref:toll-like receptor Tollo n=1 Tax=Mercenaria mercenaria TaxID=6596 RepID=UPI00234E9D2C|nr:toll-like receptor Tollo [Mercenaria mercenaria]